MADTKWIIAHPGGIGEWIPCDSFKDAFDRWYEGWNVPRLIVDGEMEDPSVSYERVRAYYREGMEG